MNQGAIAMQAARKFPLWALAFWVMIGLAHAQAPVTVTVSTISQGHAIPDDFAGLSFETASVLPDHFGVSGYFFTPANAEVVTLVHNAGVKYIRVGGGTVDGCGPQPNATDIDNLFEFAQAAGIQISYSLRLLNRVSSCPDSKLKDQDAALASHISDNYAANLASFAIGNEPDFHSYHTVDPLIVETVSGVPGSAYPSYLADWRSFASAIVGQSPNAMFAGPDTGAYNTDTYTPDPSTGVSWTEQFARDERDSGRLADVTQHHYVGGAPGSTTPQEAIDNMLSSQWVDGTEIGTQPANTTFTTYPWLYNHNLAPALAMGVGYRITEANDYLHGVAGASDAFAAALWALDYMHWWAGHGAAGVNFHNNPWIPTDTIVPGNLQNGACSPSPCSNYQVSPKGYAIKAFDLGGHGNSETVAVSNPDGINLTAYAVGNAENLYVTIINKTHGANGGSDAAVTIVPDGFTSASAAYMVLTDGHPGDASLTTATLGGAFITNNAPWQGQWTPLSLNQDGTVTLVVQATTAAIVRLLSSN